MPSSATIKLNSGHEMPIVGFGYEQVFETGNLVLILDQALESH